MLSNIVQYNVDIAKCSFERIYIVVITTHVITKGICLI